MTKGKSVLRILRSIIIEQSKRAGVGHIGSALSIIDILWVLYDKVMDVSASECDQQDRFILSKGHAALAYYAVLHQKGFITIDELNTYCADNSRLGVHPEHLINGVDFSTGSLGQGITFAVGAALAAKIKQRHSMVFCLLSDAELNEGSFWETVLFAAHHKLSNLAFILDNNGQQALGFTRDVLNISDIESVMNTTGFITSVIDGHDESQIETCLSEIKEDFLAGSRSKPSFVIANTVSGKGVGYMENKIEWHYKSMDDAHFKQAEDDLK